MVRIADLSDLLKLVVHLGEAGRVGGRLASDVLMDLIADAGVGTAVLLRGVEGFGARHRLRTDRLLSLSEDLPLVVVAVDAPTRIAPLAAEIAALLPRGLLTLEAASLLLDDAPTGGAEGKVAIYCGRGEDHAGRSAPMAVAEELRTAGLAGAIVLTGVDGVLRGERRRARAMARNRGVPSLVLAVGARERIAQALPAMRGIAGAQAITLERVSILRRDGVAVGPLPSVADIGGGSGELWQRVTVTAGEQGGDGRRPFHVGLVHDLRAARAAGASALRGSWGHTGEDGPHVERLLAIRRRGPVLVTLIERPREMARLWPIVERATASAGLVTCELVPTVRAVGDSGHRTDPDQE